MNKKTCPFCGVLFEHKIRTFCTQRCATSSSVQAWGYILWEPDAEAYLHVISGTAPTHLLIQTFNQVAAREGWSQRTLFGLRAKLKKLSLSMKATEDGWGMATLAKLLNISYDRVQLWAKRGLKSKKVATNIRSIFQKDLKAFAQAHPERMRGIEFDRLSYAIDDDILARQIVNLKPPTRGYPCKIQRLDTLEIYPSKKAAAHACFLHPSSISIAIALDRPAGEIRFRVLESTKGL